MFSDDEKNNLLSCIEEITDWQQRQDEKIEKLEDGIEDLNRAMFDNDGNKEIGGGVRSKTNFVYKTIGNWRQQFKGIRFVVLRVIFLITSGFGAWVLNFITGGG